jgi:hypothetical protein
LAKQVSEIVLASLASPGCLLDVDSDKLDQLYVKLYMERKVEKGK